MAHREYKLEYSLERASFAPLWNMLSTDEGLGRWMDCQVCSSNGITRFQWSFNEIDEAHVQISVDKKTVRFRWLNKMGDFPLRLQTLNLQKTLRSSSKVIVMKRITSPTFSFGKSR